MEKYDFDKIRKEYEAEMKVAKNTADLIEETIDTIYISRVWVRNLIGICGGLQKQITELEEAVQKIPVINAIRK